MTGSHLLEARSLTSGYSGRTVVDGVDLTLPAGRISVIVGANACGKSTLLKTLSRLIPASDGTVVLDGRAITQIPTKRLALTLGLLPQQPIAPEGIAVADLVGRGRHPHQKLFRSWTADDDAAVADALDQAGVADLADRTIDELSGGQRHRVWIAMALAQGTDMLLLDEPTTFLDVAHQIEVLDLLADLNRDRGTTIVMVLHDLNLAARYADHLVAMAGGAIQVEGRPEDVLTVDTVRTVFGLESRIVTDPTSGRPLMLPLGRHHTVGPDAGGE